MLLFNNTNNYKSNCPLELSEKSKYARSLSASSVLEVLYRYNWIISSEQHDAHEMYHALLTTLSEETVSMFYFIIWMINDNEKISI